LKLGKIVVLFVLTRAAHVTLKPWKTQPYRLQNAKRWSRESPDRCNARLKVGVQVLAAPTLKTGQPKEKFRVQQLVQQQNRPKVVPTYVLVVADRCSLIRAGHR